jgi:hypothetical protein
MDGERKTGAMAAFRISKPSSSSPRYNNMVSVITHPRDGVN